MIARRGNSTVEDDNLIKVSHHPDIHINNDDAYRYYREELVSIIDYYKYNQLPDIFVFNGDLMDNIYATGSPACNVLVTFMSNLVSLAISRGRDNIPKFRIIRGTKSHDGEQLSVLLPFTMMCDFKIIDDIYEEDIRGARVKYVAEQYCTSYEEYKEKVFVNECDMFFYHGSVEGALPIIESYGKVAQLKNHVIVRLADIERNVRGFTALGHIHPRTFIRDNVFYSGSYSSHSFADAGHSKGFDIIDYFKDTCNFDVDFVENMNIAKYEVVNISEMINTRPYDICKVRVGEILRRKGTSHHIRLDADLTNATVSKIDMFNMIKVKYPQFKYKIIKRPSDKSKEDLLEDADLANKVLDKDTPLSIKFKAEIERSVSQDELQYLYNNGSPLVVMNENGKLSVDDKYLAVKFLENHGQHIIEAE